MIIVQAFNRINFTNDDNRVVQRLFLLFIDFYNLLYL